MIKFKLINMSFLPIFLVIILITAFIITFLIGGGLLVSTILYPALSIISIFAVLACLFVFLPFSRIKEKKDVAVTGILTTSYILGVTLWTFSFIIAYDIWGFLGLAIGLFLFGIGVIPVAVMATLFALEWTIFLNLMLIILLIHTFRKYAISLQTKTQTQARREKKRPFIHTDVEEGEYEEVD